MNAVSMIEFEAVDLPASSSLSLTLPASLSFDAWQTIGRELAAREKVLNWWIGDWWAFGEHRYGERAKLAAEGLFPQSFGRLMVIGSVARAFPETLRQQQVDFTHHQEAAPLARQSAEAAHMLLERASREKMSAAQVRAAVRVIQGRPISEALAARDEDPEHYDLMTTARAWNRGCLEHRVEFFEILIARILPDLVGRYSTADTLFGDIDP